MVGGLVRARCGPHLCPSRLRARAAAESCTRTDCASTRIARTALCVPAGNKSGEANLLLQQRQHLLNTIKLVLIIELMPSPSVPPPSSQPPLFLHSKCNQESVTADCVPCAGAGWVHIDQLGCGGVGAERGPGRPVRSRLCAHKRRNASLASSCCARDAQMRRSAFHTSHSGV